MQHVIIAIRTRQGRYAQQNTLQCRRADAEKYEHVHDEELVVARHDLVVNCGERDDSVCFLGDEEEEERYEEGEEGNEDGGEQRLDQFFFPGVSFEVVALRGCMKLEWKRFNCRLVKTYQCRPYRTDVADGYQCYEG